MSEDSRSLRKPLVKSGDERSRSGSFSKQDDDKYDSKSPHSLKGDYGSIFILLVLYILQGIPLGLSGSIPLILQNYGVSYSQQAVFSLVTWPFSIKLLWAPLVDAYYSAKFGRRKSWLIPIQYLIGFGLLILSFTINNLLGSPPLVSDESKSSEEALVVPSTPNVYLLAAIFFFINFLCATQDIAVDGWALTMLSKRNVVYGSTCNTVGQTVGFTLGYLVFLALESPEVCNKYFRSVPHEGGMITLSGFLYFWAIVFLVTTTLILIFKSENAPTRSEEEMNILETYKMLYKILKLPSIQSFAILLLTCKVAFSITDSGTPLKLTEAGITKETLAFLSIPILPLQLLLPWFLSKYTKGRRPLNIFIKSYPFRLICGIVNAMLLFWTKKISNPDHSFPSYYYVVVILATAIHQVSVYCIYVALLAFHSRISDPSIGGTYMTLLNTITNLGGSWPSFMSLWLLDVLTFKHCSTSGLSCSKPDLLKKCVAGGGECNVSLDGYYVEVVILTLFGFLWLKWARSKFERIQSYAPSSWRCA